MDPIREVIARAGRRLVLASWIRHAVVMLTVAIALVVLARAIQKIAPTLTIEWSWVLPAVLGVAVVSALLAAWLRRPREMDIAQTVDERSGLRETLSTALCVEKDDSPWSKAIVTDAGEKARRVVVKDAVPIEAPGNSWWPVAACAALLAVWWLPVRDLTGMLAKKEAIQAERQQVQEVAAQVQDAQKKIDEILAKAGVEIEQNSDTEDLFNPKEVERLSADEMQRAAIKKLTQLSDSLEEKRNGEEGMTFDAITDAMKRLESPEPGPATEMSRAMARGDFAEAKKQLEKLAEQVKNGEMTQEEKEQLQKQAERMSEALGQMAQNRQQLEEQLQAAGMSEQQAKQAAADPAALEQALKDQGLSQEQIDQLKQQAQAQQNASDAAAAMSQAMGQMAQGMQAGSEQQAGEGLESMSGQLSNMEKMQSEMQSLEQAMGECSSQMASVCENPGNGQGTANGQGSQWGPNGQFQQGQSMSQGSGSGSAGQGLGTGPQEQATDFVLKNEKAKVNTTGDGPVIASTLVYGSQVRGESTAAFSEVVKSAEAQAAEAIETKRVPREHEEAVKAYFGRLQKAANEQSGTAKPAESGKDADKGSGI
jgi:hypothetical protein